MKQREIKFRAWETILQEMFPVKEIYYSDGEISHVQLPAHQNRTHSSYFKLMQFTGLLDKNGKEIYEGDIMKWIRRSALASVYWDNELARWRYDIGHESYDFDLECANTEEVIGNIYENKNLIS